MSDTFRTWRTVGGKGRGGGGGGRGVYKPTHVGGWFVWYVTMLSIFIDGRLAQVLLRCYMFLIMLRIIVVIIIIIIAFKGAIRDFLQSPHSAANRLQHVRSSGPGATVCKSRATHRALITCKCHVTCHLVRRDSSAVKFDRVSIAFIWALFYWLNH